MIDQARNVERTGMSREQAEAMVKVIHDTVADALKPVNERIDNMAVNMATKADLAALEGRIASGSRQTTLFVAYTGVGIIAALVAVAVTIVMRLG